MLGSSLYMSKRTGKMKSNNVSTCIYQRLVFIVLLVCFTLPIHAAIPNYLDYQGYLADSGGVPVNTTVSITFTLYSDAGGTTSVWTEAQNVTVSNGMFNVQLGSVAALTVTLFENPLWLGINVAGDGEITPLTEITLAAGECAVVWETIPLDAVSQASPENLKFFVWA